MKDKIVSLLNDKNNPSLSLMEINDKLGLTTAFQLKELEELLSNMAEDIEGPIYYSEKKKTYTLLENTNFLKGKLELNGKGGYGFVIVKDREDDVYISKSNIHGAGNGDIVLINILDKEKNEGEIAKIVKRDETVIVGEMSVLNNKYYVKSLADRQRAIEIPDDKILYAVEGDIVAVKKNTSNPLLGEVVKVITTSNDVNDKSVVDKYIKGYSYQYGFNPEFPTTVLEEIEKIPNIVLESDLKGRRDLRDKIIFTIDGADTKDIDDAISLDKLTNGNYELGVHIADVSNYVKVGSELDIETFKRGTSGYFGDKVVPMLPHKLSNGICSLNPSVDRLAVSCVMEITHDGKIINSDVFPSVIRSNKKMTYESVNEIIYNNNVKDDYKPFKDILIEMNKLAEILEKNFKNNGYIEFHSREPKFVFDDNRNVIDVVARVQKKAEKLIEMFMLCANISVAEYITNMGFLCPYRVHDKPKNEKLQRLLKVLSVRGCNFKFDPKKIGGRDYQNIIKEINNKFDDTVAIVLNSLLIQTMSKAVYSEDNIGHFGLGFKTYCHFTSPIRRYPDLTVHRILKDIFYDLTEERMDYWNNALPEICENSSKREQDAINCERDVDKMLSASYMEDKISNVYDAAVSGVCPFGLFVELDNTIEGLIKIDTLPGDYYVYDEEMDCIIGRNKKNKYCFGDMLRVKLVGANALNSKIDFEVYEEKEVNEKKKEKKGKKKIKSR